MYSVLHTRRNSELFFSDILGSLHLNIVMLTLLEANFEKSFDFSIH